MTTLTRHTACWWCRFLLAGLSRHGVSPLSIHERFRGDSLSCAFMTDLSNEIIDLGPNLWVHGHTHNSFDYTLGRTRVVVNLMATRMWRSTLSTIGIWLFNYRDDIGVHGYQDHDQAYAS